jgi:hypothetical protein
MKELRVFLKLKGTKNEKSPVGVLFRHDLLHWSNDPSPRFDQGNGYYKIGFLYFLLFENLQIGGQGQRHKQYSRIPFFHFILLNISTITIKYAILKITMSAFQLSIIANLNVADSLLFCIKRVK